MQKRLLLMGAGLALALTFGACGGDDDNGPTPVPTPKPPTRAVVNMIVDPNPVRANYEGGGWYRFKVNLGFSESAGIGFTISAIRVTVSSAASGLVLIDRTVAIGDHVAAYGSIIEQFTCPQYHMEGGASAAVTRFVVTIIDDNQNVITLDGQANVLHHGQPHELP